MQKVMNKAFKWKKGTRLYYCYSYQDGAVKTYNLNGTIIRGWEPCTKSYMDSCGDVCVGYGFRMRIGTDWNTVCPGKNQSPDERGQRNYFSEQEIRELAAQGKFKNDRLSAHNGGWRSFRRRGKGRGKGRISKFWEELFDLVNRDRKELT